MISLLTRRGVNRESYNLFNVLRKCRRVPWEDDSNEAVAATPDLITHVEIHKMTVHDGHRLADALDDLSERALTPAVMLGDSHYGSSDNMAPDARTEHKSRGARATAERRRLGTVDVGGFHSQRRRLGLALSQ